MIYRVGKPTDFEQIKALVGTTGYYNPIFPDTMGGHWVVAEHEGKIHACAWCILERPNAYLDYWVGKGRTALRLLAELEMGFRKLGITMVRSMIHASNTNAIQMAINGLGAYGATGYALVVKELRNGNTEDDND